ncbi:hypothetical protein Ciccas_010671 [Cichlidogyrus casuarinus]|uniref:Vomeronasal type-1 receptor n=1 Tax=Cichlidogyrus casuarinus TaxID=1844966 RepID=A0ABD2PUN3_9PLAT
MSCSPKVLNKRLFPNSGNKEHWPAVYFFLGAFFIPYVLRLLFRGCVNHKKLVLVHLLSDQLFHSLSYWLLFTSCFGVIGPIIVHLGWNQPGKHLHFNPAEELSGNDRVLVIAIMTVGRAISGLHFAINSNIHTYIHQSTADLNDYVMFHHDRRIAFNFGILMAAVLRCGDYQNLDCLMDHFLRAVYLFIPVILAAILLNGHKPFRELCQLKRFRERSDPRINKLNVIQRIAYINFFAQFFFPDFSLQWVVSSVCGGLFQLKCSMP